MKIETQKSRINDMSDSIKSFMSVPFYKIGSYKIDTDNRLLIRKGESVKLTQKEFLLLVYFAANPNILIKRSLILNDIWGDTSVGSTRSMDVFVCKVRKLIMDDPKLILINVSGVGYRLIIR